MSARSHWIASSAGLLACVLGVGALSATSRVARAQDSVQVQPDVENSRFQFSGSINSPDVYVRSGPGEEYYATLRLAPGSQVTVVGIRYDWLKILPPPGSYCYVSKLFIEKSGDGTVGRVNRPDINVRAGSDLSPMKTTVLAKLNVGDSVNIIGEQDEYYKIQPPAGTYFYVNKQFVTPIKAVAVTDAPADPILDTSDSSATTVPSKSGEATDSAAPATQPSLAAATAAPTTQPVAQAADQPPAPSPEAVAESAFIALETEFRAASEKPLEDQPVNDLAKRYSAMLNDPALGDEDKQTAGFRLAILKVRMNAQERLAEVAKAEAAAAARTQTLKVEQDELQKRLDSNNVQLYAAVGVLQASSLQFGAQTLYRLTDPASGRTVIYLRGDDADALKLIGQFVGVRGDTNTDDRLNIRVVSASTIETVDPSQVNSKIIAGVIPPSLMVHAVQASATN